MKLRLHNVIQVLLLVLGISENEAAAGDAKRVLILYPYTDSLPSIQQTQQAIQRTLGAASSPPQIYSDHLDLSEFESDDYRRSLGEFLAAKYRGVSFDLVIGISPAVISLLDEYHGTIAPGAPVLVGGVSAQTLDALDPANDLSAVISVYNVRKTIELAAALQPDARNLVVISGDTQNDRSLLRSVADDIAALSATYSIRYLTDVPFEEMRKRVAVLPRDTIVLFLSLTRDAGGRSFAIPRDAMSELARNASAPVYGLFNSLIGYGALGGATDTFDDLGSSVGTMALEMLAAPDHAPRRLVVPTALRVDARTGPLEFFAGPAAARHHPVIRHAVGQARQCNFRPGGRPPRPDPSCRLSRGAAPPETRSRVEAQGQ